MIVVLTKTLKYVSIPSTMHPISCHSHSLNQLKRIYHFKLLLFSFYTQLSSFNEYCKGLKILGSFSTLEDFWRHYSFLKNPENFPLDVSLFLSRERQTPAWETYPNGGCWILRVRKHNMIIDRIWEELCFACVGELFEHPNVVCLALTTRSREDVISLWTSTTDCQFLIGQKLKELCNLDESTQVEYKTFRSAIKDGSSFKNAKSYIYNPISATAPATSPSAGTASSKKHQGSKPSHNKDSKDHKDKNQSTKHTKISGSGSSSNHGDRNDNRTSGKKGTSNQTSRK